MSTTAPIRIAFVQAAWHEDLVARIHEGFAAGLDAEDGPRADVETVTVPGALEIPLHAQRLARTGRFDAVVAAALVVDGGVYRHDFVASAVLDGLVRVGLDTDVPVLSVVLTPHHFHEHADHHAFFHGHLEGKGREAAAAVTRTVASLRAVVGRA